MDPISLSLALLANAIQLTRDITTLVKDHKSLPSTLKKHKEELKRVQAVVKFLKDDPDFTAGRLGIEDDIYTLQDLADELSRSLEATKRDLRRGKTKSVIKNYFNGSESRKDIEAVIDQIKSIKIHIGVLISLASKRILVELFQDKVTMSTSRVETVNEAVQAATGEELPIMSLVRRAEPVDQDRVEAPRDEYEELPEELPPPSPGIHRIETGNITMEDGERLDVHMAVPDDTPAAEVSIVSGNLTLDGNSFSGRGIVVSQGARMPQRSLNVVGDVVQRGNSRQVNGNVTENLLLRLAAARGQGNAK